jgi:Domain of unknown function (DUF1841)
MTTCLYCAHRKGKRSCPALAGTICSPCCGQHRLRDIACPDDCVHLGGLAIARGATPAGFTKLDFDAAWTKLHAYAEKARDFRNEALPRVLEDPEPTQWEVELAAGYLYYGHRDAGGYRLVDLFIAACGRDLPRGEIAAAVALRDAWASMFEIVSVRSGVGLELRDLRSGEVQSVRELSATAQLQSGDVIFAWIMPLPDHLELTGVACMIPRQHRERVRSAIERELAAARARWPGTPDRELVGSTAWVVADAMRAAARDQLAGEPERSTAATPGSSLEVRPTEIAMHSAAAAREERSGEPARSASEASGNESGDTAYAPCGTTYDAEQAPDPDEWMAIDEPSKLTVIEAHHRALGVVVPRMHAAIHLIVENQLAGGAPPEARTALARLVGEGLDRHEAIHAIGSVVATAIWNVTRHEAPVDRDAMARSLADLRASAWRSE